MKYNKMKVFVSIVVISLLIIGCSEQDTVESPLDLIDIKSITIVEDPVVYEAVTPEYSPAGWYAKTVVSATTSEGTVYTHKSAGVFGELLQSSDAKDSHDIPGYGPSTFQVTLIPEFSTETTTGYYSEYKNYDDPESKKIWTFQLENNTTVNNTFVDLSNASITIALEGIFDVDYKEENGHVIYKESSLVNEVLKNRLTLIDVDHQASYTLSELKTADLGMDGQHIRTFRWVFGTVESSDYNPLNASQRAARRNSASDFEFVTKKETGGGKFGYPPL